MSQHILSLSHEQRTFFALEAFMIHAEALNQHHLEACPTPFPKAPSRWLSHYQFTPRPIALTSTGEVEVGLSWLVSATIDFSFTRSICAPVVYLPPADNCGELLPIPSVSCESDGHQSSNRLYRPS